MIAGITGSNGFVGTVLRDYLCSRGYQIKALPRKVTCSSIDGCDIIINLAGTTINQRWSKTAKQEILSSRISTTSSIVEAISQCKNPPKMLISASATGYYKNYPHNNKTSPFKQQEFDFTEDHFVEGDDFLSGVCRAWEDEALKCEKYCVVKIIRLGVVMGGNGGYLMQMKKLARAGIIPIPGRGDQVVPWISGGDLCRAIEYIINTPTLPKILNIVSPVTLCAKDISRCLSKKYRAVALPIPSFLIKILTGELSTMILNGNRVIPEALTKSGFSFLDNSVV